MKHPEDVLGPLDLEVLAHHRAELDAVRVTPTATAGSTPDASSGPFVAAGASSTASARS